MGYRLVLLVIGVLTTIGLGACHKPMAQSDGTALKVATTQQPGVKQVQQGSRLLIVLSTDDFFETPKVQLDPKKVPTIENIAERITAYALDYPHAIVYVRGYTDQTIPPYSVQTLSQQYADVIMSYLWNTGLPMDRIQAVGYGSAYPIASQKSVNGMGYNRRVEIQIN